MGEPGTGEWALILRPHDDDQEPEEPAEPRAPRHTWQAADGLRPAQQAKRRRLFGGRRETP